ncbi:MAG: TQO small subunit DoxD [Candidatus Methylomirabilaceae bacterium]
MRAPFLGEKPWELRAAGLTLAFLRIGYGLLWIKEAIWKKPPDFGMRAGDGLWYWTNEMLKYSIAAPHKYFVEHAVIPNFIFFGYLTLGTELFIGITMVLGGLTRLGALAALLMAMNITTGLIRHPAEWPSAYLMLIGYSILFLSFRAGRVLGLDALIAPRLEETQHRGLVARAIAFLV